MKFKEMKIRLGEDPSFVLNALYKKGYQWLNGDISGAVENCFVFTWLDGAITWSQKIDYFNEHHKQEAVLIGNSFIYKDDLIVVADVPTPFPFISAFTPVHLVSLTPRSESNRHRIRLIIEAMDRYSIANKAIPQEWIDELSELNSMAP